LRWHERAVGRPWTTDGLADSFAGPAGSVFRVKHVHSVIPPGLAAWAS
jgi:hypothetical protein